MLTRRSPSGHFAGHHPRRQGPSLHGRPRPVTRPVAAHRPGCPSAPELSGPVRAAVDVRLEVDQHGRSATAARTRRSAASMASAISRAVVLGAHGDLGGDQQLLRAEVHGLQVDDPSTPSAVADERRLDRARTCSAGWRTRPAAATSSRSASTTATATSSRPIIAVPTPSQMPLPVTQGQADADQGEDQAEQRGEVLEQHDRQLGRLGRADEARPTSACPGCGCYSGSPCGRRSPPARSRRPARRPAPTASRSMRLAGRGTCATPRTARTGRRG